MALYSIAPAPPTTTGRQRALRRGDALLGPHPLPRSSFAGEPALSLSKRADQSRARGRSTELDAYSRGAHRRDEHRVSLGGPPPPWPSPAGGGNRAPPRREGVGETRFPHIFTSELDAHSRGAQRRDELGVSLGGPPPPWPSRWGREPGASPQGGGWGNPVSPTPRSRREVGKAAPSREKRLASHRCAAMWGDQFSPYTSAPSSVCASSGVRPPCIPRWRCLKRPSSHQTASPA